MSNRNTDFPETANPLINLEPAQRLLQRHLEHNESYEIEIDGIRLFMLPGVFCPAFTNTSKFLANQVQVNANEIVLDMFSGSGYLGIAAAATARDVVCIDHSPIAVECARRNAALNNVTHKLEIYCGDLFEPIGQRRFDVIIANPPLLPGYPKTLLETAIFDPDFNLTQRFFREVRHHLNPGGRIYLIYSNIIEMTSKGSVAQFCEENGLSDRAIGQQSVDYEIYTVHLIYPAA